MLKILRNMKPGNLSLNFLFILMLFYYNFSYAQEQIDLQNLDPTFEEEPEIADPSIITNETSKIKSKKKTKIDTNQMIVKLKALDKITAKTSDILIEIGKKKRFGYLEILPKNCKKTLDENNSGVVAYLQVKDLSEKRDKKVFVFNGWTFSSSPTLRPFDHTVYDLWLTGCENI